MSTLLGIAFLALCVYGFISWVRGDGSSWGVWAPGKKPKQEERTWSEHGSDAWVERGGTRHAWHLILTILTVGLWIPFWILSTALSPRRRYERRR